MLMPLFDCAPLRSETGCFSIKIRLTMYYVTTLLGIMPFRVLVRAEFTQRGSLLYREGDCFTPKSIGVRKDVTLYEFKTICPLVKTLFEYQQNDY